MAHTAEELDKLTIFEMREKARKIGVASPTSKGKEELINTFLNIESGKIAPQKQSRRGRRPKSSQGESELRQRALEDNLMAKLGAECVFDESEFDNFDEIEVISAEVIAECRLDKKIGWLDLHSKGYGFLRIKNEISTALDAYVPSKLVQKFSLKMGDNIVGFARKSSGDKPCALCYIDSVNGASASESKTRKHFEMLTPVYPNERLVLENRSASKNDCLLRSIDMFAPIGKGQRAIIAVSPKTDTALLIKSLSNNIQKNYPSVELFVLVIDERPEDIAEIKRDSTAEIIFTSFEDSAELHCNSAEKVIERAKRVVESGRDAVVIVDSITRLTRAYNMNMSQSANLINGCVDQVALVKVKKLLGCARKIENGASLTIIALAGVQSGSFVEDNIYGELRQIVNSEIYLDSANSNMINIQKSFTMRAELLLPAEELKCANAVRAMYEKGNIKNSKEDVAGSFADAKSNEEFIESVRV